jgi:membrane-bound serine protease (ClpP class)
MNDTVATITAIAEERGRPVDWAVSTVEEALSYTVDEALAAGAIDIKADSIRDLLDQADGRTVAVQGEDVVLATSGVPYAELAMNPFQQFLHILSDPNIAFILLTLGFYGLFFELQNPNFVTGILGAFALILAFVGFGNLPLNVAGLLLIGLAVILFVLEVTVTSHGLLAIGGLVAFVLGASALYTQPGDPTAPAVSVDVRIIALMTALTGFFVVGIVYAAVKSRRMPQYEIGSGGLSQSPVAIGTGASVRRTLAPEGTVYTAGEEWSARTADGATLERGTLVEVVGHDGMTLVVAPLLTNPAGAAIPRTTADQPLAPRGGEPSERTA